MNRPVKWATTVEDIDPLNAEAKKIWMESDPGLRERLNARNQVIDTLTRYSEFLEKQGYLDTDWHAEPPFAIDEFLKTIFIHPSGQVFNRPKSFNRRPDLDQGDYKVWEGGGIPPCPTCGKTVEIKYANMGSLSGKVYCSEACAEEGRKLEPQQLDKSKLYAASATLPADYVQYKITMASENTFTPKGRCMNCGRYMEAKEVIELSFGEDRIRICSTDCQVDIVNRVHLADTTRRRQFLKDFQFSVERDHAPKNQEQNTRVKCANCGEPFPPGDVDPIAIGLGMKLYCSPYCRDQAKATRTSQEGEAGVAGGAAPPSTSRISDCIHPEIGCCYPNCNCPVTP